MNRIRMIVTCLIFLFAQLAQANDEVAIELPGGVPLELVWIEPGRFTMGSLEWGAEREVTISQGFYLGKYEITQEQWQAVMGTEPWSSLDGSFQDLNHPAVAISWHDAQAFAQRLNEHFDEEAYRLPTEAEWEYACRAGTTTRWSFGDGESLLSSYAWYRANAGRRVHPVGTKLPNSWGLFDLYGNAWEWVHDRYDFGAHDGTPQTDPSGPVTGHEHVVRGGGIHDFAETTEHNSRRSVSSTGSGHEIGARLLKGAPLTPLDPERSSYPQDRSSLFLPLHEGNIWIMRSHLFGHGPPQVDTTAFVLQSEIIEGEQYWRGLRLGPIEGLFRVDENGNIWTEQVRRLSQWDLYDFLQGLDDNPELRESQYFQQSSLFKHLDSESKDRLFYDFDDVTIDPNSPTLDLDREVSNLYLESITRSGGAFVMKNPDPGPDQRSFRFVCCGSEASSGEIVFQRGLGPVRTTWWSSFNPSRQTNITLLWVRIDGKGYGVHPGPRYPGYRDPETVVTTSDPTHARPSASGLEPNYPNPFNASTRIPYRVATPGPVRLAIYNALGQPVRTLVDQVLAVGVYQARWDARDQEETGVAAGVYFTRLHYPGGVQTRRLLSLK